MIEHIASEIDRLANLECNRCIAGKGLFVDGHQAYGVIQEEIEECAEELIKLLDHFDWFWDCIRKDEDATDMAKVMKLRATLMAAEAVQAAAMAQKYIESFGLSNE